VKNGKSKAAKQVEDPPVFWRASQLLTKEKWHISSNTGAIKYINLR
jgi:hypothetical protein